ncbi:MAG: anthranilate synthase component I family protein [Leptospirales bacterium]
MNNFSLQSLRSIRNLPWDPAAILSSSSRDPTLPKIILDRRDTLGWSFIPWRFDSILKDDGFGHSRYSLFSHRGYRDQPKDILKGIRIPAKRTHLSSSLEIIPPFSNGYFLLLPFEWGEQFQPSGTPHTSRGFPLILADCPEVISYHHDSRTLFLPPSCPDPPFKALRTPDRKPSSPIALHPSLSFEEYCIRLERIGNAIGRGDYFQLNFAITFDGFLLEREIDPLSLYISLSRINPSPGMGYFSWGGTTIVSNSPERLATIWDGQIITTPIAGTSPIFEGIENPHSQFLSDPKEKAEHIMTVDLLRNDLGRICESGSITVDRLLSVERYAHLYHLVSDIQGTLRSDLSAWELLSAIFPGGSVTGAPKTAVRKAIGHLEEKPRGYYCGTFGFLDRSGCWDLNLLIRTLFITGNRLSLPIGSGIVADSNPEREYREVHVKAATFLNRLGNIHEQ